MALCYMDMTWCPYSKDCAKALTCFRAPSVEDYVKAEEMGLPFCMFSEVPSCFIPLVEITDADYPEVRV